MSVAERLVSEFLTLAVEELLNAGSEVNLPAQHHVLTEWCEVYEDVPPRNRAERAVRDALVMARDLTAQRIHEPLLTV